MCEIKAKLSANQINWISEIEIDKKVTDKSLELAISHHSNRHNELLKDERKFWDEMLEIHNLDKHKKWKLSSIDNATCIVEDND